MANNKYDWKKIEQHFLENKQCSLKLLSETFEIPYQSVRRYAGKNKWHNLRYRKRIEEEHGMRYEEYIQNLYREAMEC